jgi:hypothetical protein
MEKEDEMMRIIVQRENMIVVLVMDIMREVLGAFLMLRRVRLIIKC